MRYAAFILAILALCAPRHAAAADWQGGVSPYVGATQLDARLSDFRWDTTPNSLLGIEGFAQRGFMQVALVVERSATTQGTGIPSATTVPTVDLTHIALRLRAEVLKLGPLAFHAGAGIGRLHLSWTPDSAEFEITGLTEPLLVKFESIGTWRRELGAEVAYSLREDLALGLRTTVASFDLETAHRRGDEIVLIDDTFTTFDAALFVRWSFVGAH